MQLRVKKLDPEAKLPSRAHSGDAGVDFYALEGVTIKPGERVLVKTGVAIEFPMGYVGLFWDKSGLANNHGLKTMGGVIDAGYRGEILIGLVNLSAETYVLEKHHKVAQILIQKVELAEVVEVTELSDTSRGEGGFGSTCK